MEKMRFFSDCYGAHNNQVDMIIVTVDMTAGDSVVGELDYCIFGGKLHINHIWVVENHRRQGIATQMLHQMEEDNLGYPILWGMTTNAGTALKASYVASCDKKGK